MLLSEILREMRLDEITRDTVLYHRSMDKYKMGDIINPEKRPEAEKGESHWLSKKFTEKKLEEYRKKINPNAPSRFNCVFCSIVPRSAFTGKGYLYEVKPKGKFLVTLSYLINKIAEEFSREKNFRWPPEKASYSNEDDYKKAWAEFEREGNLDAWRSSQHKLETLFEWYWRGINVDEGFKKNSKWVEVLCEQVIVIGIGGESSYEFLKQGDRVEFLRDITDVDFIGYDATGTKKLPEDKIQKIVNHFSGIRGDRGDSWKLTLPKGMKATVKSVMVDQHKVKDFGVEDAYGVYTSPYRILKLIPDGYDFYFDARWFLFNLNYRSRKKIKPSEVFKKI